MHAEAILLCNVHTYIWTLHKERLVLSVYTTEQKLASCHNHPPYINEFAQTII